MAATVGFELIHLDEAQSSIDPVTHQSPGFGHRGRSAKVTEGSNRFPYNFINPVGIALPASSNIVTSSAEQLNQTVSFKFFPVRGETLAQTV